MMPLGGLRECRATSFDQMPTGKYSRAGRLTRNAPRLSNHVCAGNFVNAVPRRDIWRGPRLPTFTRGLFSALPDKAVNVSSGIDLATHVPAPTKVSKYPSASNWSYAFSTGMRGIFSSPARLLVDGTRWPGRNWPSRMALRNQSYS